MDDMSKNRSLSDAIPAYTIDDVFDRLRRPDWVEMNELHTQWKYGESSPYSHLDSTNSMNNIVFMEAHGWDWVEYLEEGQRRRNAGLTPHTG
jgi:hypothetical protein